NGRYFLFHTGVGFDAAVVEQVERRSGLKRYAGHPLFVYAGVDTWIRHYDRSRPRFAVSFPPEAGDDVIDDAYLTIVLNTNPYTFLGNRPLDLAPEATLDRGLAAVTVRTMAFTRFLPIIASAPRPPPPPPLAPAPARPAPASARRRPAPPLRAPAPPPPPPPPPAPAAPPRPAPAAPAPPPAGPRPGPQPLGRAIRARLARQS